MARTEAFVVDRDGVSCVLLTFSVETMRLTVDIIIASFTLGVFENVQEEPQGFHLVLDLSHWRFGVQHGPGDSDSSIHDHRASYS